MIAWLKKVALCLLARVLGDDVEKTAAVGTLEAEVKAANEAPSSREETAKLLGRDGF